MKNFRISIVVPVMLAMTGCFAEDFSFCPPEHNVILHFRLPDDAGEQECTFLDNISTVHTAIYTTDGTLVQSHTTVDDEHHGFKGLRLSLEPGTYHVVSWGNHGTNTSMYRYEDAYDNDILSRVSYSTINKVGQHRITGDGDELYYAPHGLGATRADADAGSGTAEADHYVMEVDPVDGHEGILDFGHAHRSIEVFVKGFSSNGMTPIIQLEGLPDGLNYLGMKKLEGGGLVTSEVPSEVVNISAGPLSAKYALSDFETFYMWTGDHDVIIRLLDPVTREVVYQTRLNDHVHPDSDDPEGEKTIQILIEFIDAGVNVSIPNWKQETITPGFWD